MSFGDGDLHELVEELEADKERLLDLNGELCAEVNRLYGDNVRLRAFSNEAWAELEAIGPTGVFCFERLEELAQGCGVA